MSTLHDTTIVQRHPEAAHRVVEDQAIIVMPRDARILTVNGVGTFIWDAIGDHTVATLAQAVTERFEVDYDQALVDTRSFLESLLDRGLVICPKVVHATADERDA